MKHQYFGDISDYRKYGLLRCLSAAGLRLGVFWMLTSDDDRSDGRRTGYLDEPAAWRRFDPELFDFLAGSVRAGRRDVAAFESSGLTVDARYCASPLDNSAMARPAWFDRGLADLASTDLVFFDPDNGLEVSSIGYGKRGSRKYVYWREIAATWAAGHSLLIFQHFNRSARGAFIERLWADLERRTSGSRVAALATSHVLFLFAVQPRHAARFDRAMQFVSERWRGQIDEVAAAAPMRISAE
jgi:hypothetical protein